MSATTPMSWVISSSPVPVSRRSRFISARICAWMVTSSAVVGSSAISRRGRQISAIAIITRWHIPPESSNGYCGIRRSGAAMPTSSSIASAALVGGAAALAGDA